MVMWAQSFAQSRKDLNQIKNTLPSPSLTDEWTDSTKVAVIYRGYVIIAEPCTEGKLLIELLINW